MVEHTGTAEDRRTLSARRSWPRFHATRPLRCVPGGALLGTYRLVIGTVFDFIFHTSGQHVAQCCHADLHGHLLTLTGLGLTLASVAHGAFIRYAPHHHTRTLTTLAALVITASAMRNPHVRRRHS